MNDGPYFFEGEDATEAPEFIRVSVGQACAKLEIDPDLVIACSQRENHVSILWTKDDDESHPIWQACFNRNPATHRLEVCDGPKPCPLLELG